MRVLKVNPYLTETELKKTMDSQKTVTDFKDWQVIYSVCKNKGKTAKEIADILGIKVTNVYQKVQKYNKLGMSWKTAVKRGGRREERCIMTLEKEKEFLKSIETDALNGQIITYRQIKSKLEKQTGRTISDDYIWDTFKRHKWTKKVPRQSHPKADKAAQEEFKKNSRKIWLPSH
jgi:transposase